MKVRLIWTNDQNQRFDEIVETVSPHYSLHVSGVKLENSSELVSNLYQDYLLFEDEEGLFLVRPGQIEDIHGVEED